MANSNSFFFFRENVNTINRKNNIISVIVIFDIIGPNVITGGILLPLFYQMIHYYCYYGAVISTPMAADDKYGDTLIMHAKREVDRSRHIWVNGYIGIRIHGYIEIKGY